MPQSKNLPPQMALYNTVKKSNAEITNLTDGTKYYFSIKVCPPQADESAYSNVTDRRTL